MKIPFRLLICLLLFSQCEKPDPADPIDPRDIDEGKVESSLNDFGNSNNAVALDLLHEVVSTNVEAGKNIVVSPLSVHTALLMVLNGADKETHEAIATTLHSAGYSETSMNKAYKAYEEYHANAHDAELQLANSVFWDKNRITPSEAFSEKMLEYYLAELSGLTFQDPTALETINNWVNASTEGRIEKILEEIRPEEVLFLINALYFKGDWSNPFLPGLTFERSFTHSDDRVSSVPTMSHDALFSFAQSADYQAVDLFFGDSTFSLTFILPAEATTSLDDFIGKFTTEDLKQLYQNLQTQRLQIYLPKFEVKYKINLNEALRSLGMGIAFDPFGANFNRLGTAPEGNLFISRVEHKTFLKIDEKGAEGAAVTSVGIGVTSAPPTIAFDRPFMLVLRDVRYNSVVFIGKIEDPLAD